MWKIPLQAISTSSKWTLINAGRLWIGGKTLFSALFMNVVLHFSERRLLQDRLTTAERFLGSQVVETVQLKEKLQLAKEKSEQQLKEAKQRELELQQEVMQLKKGISK